MEKYSAQRSQQLATKSESTSAKPLIPPKNFAEDTDGQSMAVQADAASQQNNNDLSNLAAIEESKQELENTKANNVAV